MKKLCIASIVLSIVLGLARIADLFLWTDWKTGFVQGGAFWRYLLFLPMLALAFAAAAGVPYGRPLYINPHCRPGVKSLMCLCGAFSGGYAVWLFVLSAADLSDLPQSHHTNALTETMGTMADMAGVLFFAGLAAWLIVLAVHLARGSMPDESWRSAMLLLAIPATLGFYLYIVRNVVMRSASAQRVPAVMEAVAVVTVLVYLTVAAKSLLTPAQDGARRTVFWGLMAFGCATCLMMPQSIWLALNRMRAMSLLLALLCGSVGLLGAFTALCACEAPQQGSGGF